jgi:hypothetical protein
MSKKTVALALSLFVVLVLAGCNQKDASKSEQKKTQEDTQVQSQVKEQPKEISSEISSACQDKAEGDVCETTMPQSEDKIAGTCKKSPKNEQLMCWPDNMPERGQGGPGGPGGQRSISK